MTNTRVNELMWATLFRRLTIELAAISISCFLVAASVTAQSVRESVPPNNQSEQTEHQRHSPVAENEQAQPPAPKTQIPDVEVFDQDGKKVRFYSDLIKGKVVVVNLVYTTCTSLCPLNGASFARLEALLGNRLGRDVYLISVSIDPVTDTPERLRAWGAKFRARPGWTLVTGDKSQIEEVIRAFTGDTPNKADHSPVAFLINDPKGVRIRAYGLGDSQRWAQLLAEVMTVSP